jgi:hypothetical protein
MTTNARPKARRNGIAARLAVVSLAALATATLVTACGGGSGGGTSVTPNRCTVNDEKQFVLDAARSWYLFPELLPANVNIGSYATADDLLDAITAEARAQGKDRFFSYLTTREADQALFGEGEFIGFGFRSSVEGNQLFLLDVFENTPASEGGLRRGAEVLAIDANDGRGFVPMATILVNDPNLTNAFGPATTGVQRGFRSVWPGVTTEVTLTKRLNTITPISPDGGVRVLTLPSNPSVQVGYVALRTFISTARLAAAERLPGLPAAEHRLFHRGPALQRRRPGLHRRPAGRPVRAGAGRPALLGHSLQPGAGRPTTRTAISRPWPSPSRPSGSPSSRPAARLRPARWSSTRWTLTGRSRSSAPTPSASR